MLIIIVSSDQPRNPLFSLKLNYTKFRPNPRNTENNDLYKRTKLTKIRDIDGYRLNSQNVGNSELQIFGKSWIYGQTTNIVGFGFVEW
jgi:hypothetical protein